MQIETIKLIVRAFLFGMFCNNYNLMGLSKMIHTTRSESMRIIYMNLLLQ